MNPVRGIITTPLFPDGIPRNGPEQPLTVELVRGTEDQEGPFSRPEHATAVGLPCLRDVFDGTMYLVEDLPPFSELRVIEPPTDDEGRELLDGVVKEGFRSLARRFLVRPESSSAPRSATVELTERPTLAASRTRARRTVGGACS